MLSLDTVEFEIHKSILTLSKLEAGGRKVSIALHITPSIFRSITDSVRWQYYARGSVSMSTAGIIADVLNTVSRYPWDRDPWYRRVVEWFTYKLRRSKV